MIIVKGVRRVGNNFIGATLNLNSDCNKTSGGVNGTHRLLTNTDFGKPIVVIIKNPYSWFKSIRWWTKESWSWSDTRWEKEWPILFERFNNFYAFHKNLCGSENNMHVVRYEDLLREPDLEFNTLIQNLGFNKTTEKIVLPKKVNDSESFTDKKRRHYLAGGAFGLENSQIKIINKNLDWSVMSFYGYEVYE